MKVLIVDDNTQDRMLLSKILSFNKHVVTEATNGADALEKIKINKPDIIISDVMMPVMDGFILLKEVRKNESLKDIPFIFYSAAYVEKKDIELAETLGISKFITKPAEIRDIVNQINEVVSDITKGRTKIKESDILEDQYLDQYSSRIFHKLEEKVIQLEKEIEERKVVEDSLKKAEQIAHVGHWTWYIETNKLVCSDEMFHIFGITKMQFEEYQPDLNEIFDMAVHPDDRYTVKKAHMETILESQNSSQFPLEFPLEYRVIWPDGSIHTVLAQPGEKFVNQSGNLVKLFGIVQDITERKQIENAIIESKEKYKSLFESAIDAVFIIDANTGIILDANNQAERLLNKSKDQIIERHHSTLYPKENTLHINHTEHIDNSKYIDNAKYIDNTICLRMDMKATYPTYNNVITSDGRIIPVEINAGIVNLPNGKQIVQGIFRDITERKIVEEKLRKSEENLRYAQRVSHTGNWEWDIKKNKMTWSEETFRIHGLDPTKSEPNFDQLEELYHQEDVPEFEKAMKDCIYQGGSCKVVCRITHPDRSLHYLEIRGGVVRDNKGNIVKLFGTSSDITERKIVEEKLQKSEQLYRTITENSNDSIWSSDEFGNFTFMNKRSENLSGYSWEDLKGKSFAPLILPHDLDRVTKIVETVLSGIPQQFETSYIGKYGQTVTLSINTAPIFQNGKVVGTISSGRDITETVKQAKELKLLTEKLTRSNKDLEQFAYVASHDLQEPLRTIYGFAELLEANYGDKLDSDAKEFIEYITTGARRMQQMVNDLLALSRIGTKGKEFVPTNIERILRIVFENLHSLIEKNNAIITYDSMPTIMVDDSQIIQLFQNLIDNAIKFRRKEIPNIIISSKRKNGEFLFSIKDNGIGIDKNQFKKLFIIFQRLHSREKYPGTGIGLAICKKIVERHGGSIWVESEVDKGSTFFFTIPIRYNDNKVDDSQLPQP